jgi:hypothetical protein
MIFTQLLFEEIDVGLICGLLYFLRMHSDIMLQNAPVPLCYHANLFILTQHSHAAPTLILFSATVLTWVQAAVSAACTFYLSVRSCYSFRKYTAYVLSSVASSGTEFVEFHLPDISISLLATCTVCFRAGICHFL